MRRLLPSIPFALLAACGAPTPAPSAQQNVIEIDVDDHGLSGLWAANAPNLKGLIAGGTLAYTRVDVPTHSNHNNMTLLTGQYPDGDDVPANSFLERTNNYKQALSLGSLALGDYALYPDNPLLNRGDSVYLAAERLGDKPSYFGQLPPFEAGASDIHFTIIGDTLAGIQIDEGIAQTLLSGYLDYPQNVISEINYDGPGDVDAGETLTHFTIRDAALYLQNHPQPRYMFIWDFLALDSDPTTQFGADGPALAAVIEDYDDAIGDLLTALQAKGTLDNTNIVFTLDHGKVDSYNQVAFGSYGGLADGGPGDGQLGALVASEGPALGIDGTNYNLINEDGDTLIWAVVPNAGTAAGAAEQQRVTHALLSIIQSGKITGLDTTRTLTFDGAMGTLRFDDFRNEGPFQADIIVFPSDGFGTGQNALAWTLTQIDPDNAVPGPFLTHAKYPFGRHGGFSEDELYVPLIMSGPAFKKGALLPHTTNHADVAPTAMMALGTSLTTAEGMPILAAFQGQPGETLPQPTDMTTSRPTVLKGSGYDGAIAPVTAGSAVIIDVAGLYYDEVFTDTSTRGAAQPFLDIGAQGVVFDHFLARYRDWPVNEYELLTGGYPVSPTWIPFAEDDPAQACAPGWGLLAMPPAANFISDPAGHTAWNTAQQFGMPTVLDAAQAAGIRVALLGQKGATDTKLLHIDSSKVDLQEAVDPGSMPGIVSGFISDHPRSLVVVSLGGSRTADRHSSQAASELSTLGQEVQAIVSSSFGSLVLITSRGATSLDDAGPPDYYGPGSSRHVPLIAIGPNTRAGIVTSQPGDLADIPATVLVGLGLPNRTDFGTGTWAAGSAVNGVPHPTPSGATAGHALVRAFAL